LSNQDIQSIIIDIKKKVKHKKTKFDDLMNFIVSELSKQKENIDTKTLDLISENIESNYYSKEEIKSTLENKINNINSFKSIPVSHIGDTRFNFESLLNSMEQNKDLIALGDKTFNFSKNHLNFLRKIFYLQTTQNYLSALRWYITDDLVTKQNKFNTSTENSIKKILSLIHEIKMEHDILIRELKDYARVSEQWIQTDQAKIRELELKTNELASLQSQESNQEKFFEDNLMSSFMLKKILDIEQIVKKSLVEDIGLDLKENDILYFLHIPKAAGTSFISVLDNYFDLNRICKLHDWEEMLTNMPKDISKLNLFRGHFGYGIHHILQQKPVYITMLREPISRTISDFQQSTRTKKMGVEKPFFKNSELSKLVTSSETKWRFTNNQTRHIVIDLEPSFLQNSSDKDKIDSFSRFLEPSFKHPKFSDEKLLEIAKQRISEFAFVGIAEKFEESLMLLCYIFGWKPLRIVPQLNVLPTKIIQKNISTNTFEAIKECTKIDSELYNFALRQFDERFSYMVQILMQKYYTPDLSNLSFKELLYSLLERNYLDRYWKSKPTVSSINYDFSQPLLGSGWYLRELDPDDNIFRWTGPGTESVIDLPKLEGKNFKIQFRVVSYSLPEILDSLTLKINDVPIKLKTKNKDLTKKQVIFEGEIPNDALETPRNFIQIKFEVNKTTSLKKINADSNDTRKLGIGIEWIKIINQLK